MFKELSEEDEPILETDYKQSNTLISFAFYNFKPVKNLKIHKMRLKIYNKGTQAIESDNVFTKISTGIKKIVHDDGSEQSARFFETRL